MAEIEESLQLIDSAPAGKWTRSTFHALNLAKKSGARFQLASTSETYGTRRFALRPRLTAEMSPPWAHVLFMTKQNASQSL